MSFTQKLLSGIVLLAIGLWFFGSIPTISHLTFSPTKDIKLVSTEHLRMTENDFGTIFQEILFGDVMMRFVVHVAENIAFASSADQTAVHSFSLFNLFDLAIMKFKEKVGVISDRSVQVFIPIFGACVLLVALSLRNPLSKELLGILAVLARGRIGVHQDYLTHHNNKYFSG